MKDTFKTFVKKDRSEFIGIIDGTVYTSQTPVNILNPECTIEECKQELYFAGSKATKTEFFHNNDLVTFKLIEV